MPMMDFRKGVQDYESEFTYNNHKTKRNFDFNEDLQSTEDVASRAYIASLRSIETENYSTANFE